MNIRENIEAGHYPTDDKGRALVPAIRHTGLGVPTNHEFVVTICATDKPGSKCLLGWMPTAAIVGSIEMAWDEDGTATERSSYTTLLPPPPRKVPIKGWAIIDRAGVILRICATPRSSDVIGAPSLGHRVVELSGEYEEPWA